MDELTSPSAAPAARRSRGRAAAASAHAAALVATGGRQGRGYGRAAQAGRGRGRGRGRAASRPRAPSLPQPPDPQPEGIELAATAYADSNHYSSSQSGSGDEHGWEQQQQAVQPPRPQQPQLSVRQQAEQLLVQSTGVPSDRAAMALDATRSDPEHNDALAWVDDAQIWLAERAEFEDERDRLAETMRVSLEEAELRKAAQKPLAERPPEEIQQEFAASELLCRLAERRSLASLLAPPVRQPLLAYLVLEAKCRRWYSVSRHYFSAAATQLAATLDDAVGEAGSGRGQSDAADGEEEPASKRRRAEQAERGGPCSAAPVSGEQAAALAAALDCAREEVQAAVFAMPAGGDCIEVPQLFVGAVPAGAEEEVVVLDSEGEEGEGSPPQQQQQQQEQEQAG